MAVDIGELTGDSYAELVAKSEKAVIIDFWGPRCVPCLALGPTFDGLAERHPEMTFLRAEAPANRMLCVDLKVMSLPTFLCMVDGTEISRLDGQITAASLSEWVKAQSAEKKGDS